MFARGPLRRPCAQAVGPPRSHGTTEAIVEPMNALVAALRDAEQTAAYAASLAAQLPGQSRVVEQLLAGRGAVELDDAERAAVEDLFIATAGTMALAYPETREFVLTVTAPRPHCTSRAVPQRIYAHLSQDEFRMAEALAEDALFFS